MPDKMDSVEQLMAMRNLDEIFALEDDTDFAIALYSALCDWTEFGEHLDAISPEAQVFYLCNALDEKVNSDGLYGFLIESYGRWTPETADALETIGAPRTAKILLRAIALFPDGPFPRDYEERENLLLDENASYSEECDKLDSEFYAYPDGVLQDLYISYARNHRDCFSAPEK